MVRTAFAVGFLCLSAPAIASSTVSQTLPVAPFVVSAGTASSIIGNVASDVSLIDVVVQPFDNNLGTLDSVRFLSSVTGEGSVPGTSGGSLAFTIGGDYSVDGDTYGSGSISRSASSTIGGVSGDATLLDDTTIDATTLDPTEQSILATITGPVAYNFTLMGDQVFNRFLTGTLEVTEGFVTVEYNFTPIPEPTSLCLIALGGLAVAGVRTRR